MIPVDKFQHGSVLVNPTRFNFHNLVFLFLQWNKVVRRRTKMRINMDGPAVRISQPLEEAA